MTKTINVVVPDNTVALIMAYQIAEDNRSVTMGQTTIDSNSIKNEKTIDINKLVKESKENNK